MEKEEVLEKVGKKKAVVGEMEKAKINKASWIALIISGVLAVALMITEGALGHHPAIFAIGAICYTWACSFYLGQYFIAKRPKGVLVGAILEGLAAVAMLTFYILFNVGVF